VNGITCICVCCKRSVLFPSYDQAVIAFLLLLLLLRLRLRRPPNHIICHLLCRCLLFNLLCRRRLLMMVLRFLLLLLLICVMNTLCLLLVFLCPRHSKNGGGALSVTHVRAFVRPSVRPSVCPSVIKNCCPRNNF